MEMNQGATWSATSGDAATAAAVATGALTALALKQYFSTSGNAKEVYRDEDGEATEKSQSLCSAGTQKAIVNAAAAVGLSAAFQRAMFATDAYQTAQLGHWSRIFPWIAIATQAVVLTAETRFHQRYTTGLCLASSSVSTVLAIVYHAVYQQSVSLHSVLLQIGSLLVIFLSSLSIPQRPLVFYRNDRVDRELAVSFLDRLFFAWGPFHQYGAVMPKELRMEDLPEVRNCTRMRTMKGLFRATGVQSNRLWMQLVRTVWPVMIQQWLLVLLTAAAQFGSRFALFKLLQFLEVPAGNYVIAWIWVAGLGAGLLVETVANSWLIWVTQMKLQIPIESLLKAMIFDKMARRPLATQSDAESGSKTGTNSESSEKLSLTDLLSNTCMETATAYAHTHHFLMVIFKLIIDFGYLAQLLGLKSVIIGTSASLLMAPLSTRLSQRHRAERSKRTKLHSVVSNLVSEVLQELRHIRLSSMESVWKRKLNQAREQELEQMWNTDIAMALLSLVVNLSPVLLASLALSTYAYDTGHLSSSVAFLSLNLFSSLHAAFQELPERFSEIRVSWSSCERLQRYFDEPEREVSSANGNKVSLEKAKISWQSQSSLAGSTPNFTLSNLDVEFPSDALSIVTGRTGSGKSLLMAAILDEAHLQSGLLLRPPALRQPDEKGSHILPGTTALVSQPPWIENCTVHDNILFGIPYDATRYQKVLNACALDRDLEILPKGDQTAAGLNGAFLSGGQKWRVALARAFYSTAEIIILDDVLSAVDTRVARQICDKALAGDLAKGRTIILVTHNAEACRAAVKYHVVVENGTATGKLETNSLSKLQGDSGEYVHITSGDDAALEPAKAEKSGVPARKKGKLAVMSASETFSAYIWASGGMQTLLAGVVVTFIARGAANSNTWWLTRWTAQHGSLGDDSSLAYNIGVYLMLSLCTVLSLEVRALILQSMSINGSRSLFRQLVNSVLYAPLSWIDGMPLGHMIQTLETDVYTMDNKTTQMLHNVLGNAIHLVFILITGFLSAPQSIVFSLLLLFAYWKIATTQLSIGQQLLGLIDASFRPVLEHMTSVASGIATIRAFNRTDVYVGKMNDLLDTSSKLGLHLILGQRWLAVRLGSLSAVFVTIMAAALVYQGESAARTGLVISLALQLKSALGGSVSAFSLRNLVSRSLGRIVSLANTRTESQQGEEPPTSWPADGGIEVRGVTVSYDSSIQPALNNVSFAVQPYTRVGIVGRTGAGKTSLTNALLRFIDVTEGKIMVDGLDISTVKLERVRKAFSLIPQDPFLFSGTLRSNIDPDGTKTDGELLTALVRVHLVAAPEDKKSKFSDLDMAIDSGGKNLSYGERQLICMARALLIKCPILILDEATSAVDGAMDAAIQKVIREQFSGATILVVAHRLLTVADFDSILVMSDGQVAEFGPPAELMAKKGVFWSMVQQSGDSERIVHAIKKE